MVLEEVTPVDPVAQYMIERSKAEKERLAKEQEETILSKLIDEGWDIKVEGGGNWSATMPGRVWP